MNMLQKLDMLMADKGINKSQLAALADIPYTTIDGLYKKGYENVKLPTLRKLSKFFHVSMEYLTNDDVDQEETTSSLPNSGSELDHYTVQLAKKLQELDDESLKLLSAHADLLLKYQQDREG